MNLFRVLQKIKMHSFFLIFDMLLTVSFASYFIFQGQGIVGAVVGLLISKILVFIGMMSFVFKEVSFGFPKFINLREHIHFSLPLLPSNFSSWIINSSDRYVITIFLGTAFAGYYAPGYTLGSLILTFATPLSFLLPPVLSKYYDENKLNEFKRVLRYSVKYYLIVAIPSVFGLSVLSKPILAVLTTPEIASIGYLITPYTAVSYILYGLQGIISNILIVQKKTKIIGYSMSLSAAINLGVNIIIVPLIGINGAAITTLISFILIFIIVLYYSSKAKLFIFDLNFLIKSIIASCFMAFVVVALNPVEIFSLVISIIAGAIIYFGLILLFKGVRKEEIKFFKELLKY
jgi:O-antigen/teichoic acid export membrane protein